MTRVLVVLYLVVITSPVEIVAVAALLCVAVWSWA